MADISELVGKTFREVRNVDNEAIQFIGDDGDYRMFHEQDCCESVTVNDICGDLHDLEGAPILSAEESSSNTNPEGVTPPEWQDSFTWTFHRIATIKGSVVIRWYGSSNGYYSESVYFKRIPS